MVMTTVRFWKVRGGWRFKIMLSYGGYVSAPYPTLRAALIGAWRARKEAPSL